VGSRELWRRGQHGWPARYPLVQFPNAPLLVALVASVVAALTGGSVHDYARGGVYAGLAAWAWIELASGDNSFRRALGLAGVVYVAVQIGRAFGA
jgi:hypothetical protein